MNRYPMIDLVKTGENITRLMKLNNIKISDLQEVLGFEYPQAIYKWKRGECLPTIDNLVILATVFKTTIDKIIVTYLAHMAATWPPCVVYSFCNNSFLLSHPCRIDRRVRAN